MNLLDYMEQYPNRAGYKVEGPSREAAEGMKGRCEKLRADILALLKHTSLTADETAILLKETVLTVRPRFSELLAHKKIEDAGERRRNASGATATVWRYRPPPNAS